MPQFRRPNYTATKLALEGLTQALGYELKGRVAVNVLRLDLPVWSEGFAATLPEDTDLFFEDPVIMSDAVLSGHSRLAIVAIVAFLAVSIALLRRGIRLVADDGAAESPGGAADRGPLRRVVMHLVADDRSSAGAKRAAGERALFTAAEWSRGAGGKHQ
jgi:hypothetical protein